MSETDNSVDDLVSGLASSFGVSDDVGYNTAAQHPRFASYKNKNQPYESQEKRRQEFLDQQKRSRFDQVMLARKLALNEFDESDLSPEEGDTPMDATVSSVKKGHYQRKYTKTMFYKDRLMLSEWLVDIPEAAELNNDWLMLPCPEGRRCLVVAAKGVTTVYSKSGYQMNQFPSLLPGGKGRHTGEDYTLLDCIYSEIDSTYFVLDLMCWHNYPVFDSDTEFRFFWLTSKLAELPDLADKSRTNPYRFISLPYCPCTKDEMLTFLKQDFGFKAKLDGLLFYHKRAHYWSGRTPLVGWLKPFMLPEILDVQVPQCFIQGHEQDSAAQFIQQFNTEYADKQKRRSGNQP